MKLSRISVANHSRFSDLDIEVRDHLVLVGPNDVGKSALLRCLDLLLGASTAQLYQRLTAADFRDPDQSLVMSAELRDLSNDDKAFFADEITVDPAGGPVKLTIRLVVDVDAAGTLSIFRTAPDSGTGRQLSREQVARLGWRLLEATGLSRDLRDDRRNAVDDILQAIDLGNEKADFEALIAQLQEKLQSSEILDTLRESLAIQLSKALPTAVQKEDLIFRQGAVAEDDVLSDVSLQVASGGDAKSLAEQSDGTRALYVIALYDLVSAKANIVAIDEPEIHLHPTSQRSLAGLLREGANQKLLATHSPDIVGAFTPDCIVAVRPGGAFVQPSGEFLNDDDKLRVRWWVRDRLEPLTARHVIAVEGPSDRIVLQQASEACGCNLDRLGISVIEAGGWTVMPAIIKLFGSAGFDVPMSLLIDEDAREKMADRLGVAADDLEEHSTWIADPDLEAEYVEALGANPVWEAIHASGLFSTNQKLNCATTGPGGTRSAADVADFCRAHKVEAALIVAPLVTAAVVPNLLSGRFRN